MTQPLHKTTNLVIDLQPVGRRIAVPPGTSILKATQESGIGLVSLCGGEGWCESCLIRVTTGQVNPPTQSEMDYLNDEDIESGFRLACQVIPETDVRVDIPAESLSTPQRLQIEGKSFEIPLAPNLEIIELVIKPPSIHDLQADADRLLDVLKDKGHLDTHIGLPVLIDLSGLLRANSWQVRVVVRESEVIAVLPPDSGIFGISVDIGTTKLALYLVDLLTGEVINKVGEMNPQIAYGEDVVSRIAYATQNEGGRAALQRTLVKVINNLISEVCQAAGIRNWQVVDAVMVGNTAMHHLVAGLPVEQLVLAPYVPAINDSMDIRSQTIGIEMAAGGYIHLLPNIAGYVGGDHAAVILSTELWKTDQTVMVIDVGTNTEISLVSNGNISSCSCASGPAFEGAHITNGIRAAPGAIERVQIIDGDIKTFTIDDKLPIRICGSGILDVVAEMKAANLMDERGALIEGQMYIRRSEKNNLECLLVSHEHSGHGRDISVTRNDVNEIQLAKAAIRAGQEILMEKAGIKADQINEIIIAGAFGTYIDVPNAIRIGMFPDIPVERFHQVGNAAGMGATQALISFNQRKIIQGIIRDVEYIELTTYENFQAEFIKAMYLR